MRNIVIIASRAAGQEKSRLLGLKLLIEVKMKILFRCFFFLFSVQDRIPLQWTKKKQRKSPLPSSDSHDY